MKILHISLSLGGGGAERIAVCLCNRFAAKGDVEVVFVSVLNDADPKNVFYLKDLNPRVRHVNLHCQAGLQMKAFWRVYQTIRQERPDVVHTHYGAVQLLFPTLLLPGVHYFHTIHTLPRRVEDNAGFLKRTIRSYLFTSNSVKPFTISEACHRSYRETYHADNDICIPNGSEALTVTQDLPSVTKEIDSKIHLPVSGGYTLLDLLGGRQEDGFSEDGRVKLRLMPCESAVLVFDTSESARPLTAPAKPLKPETLNAKWEIALADCEDLNTYVTAAESAGLTTVEDIKPDFAGRIRYTARLENAQDIKQLELKGVGDTALLEINGQLAGRRISGPFVFRTEGLWQAGVNTLTITVSTTLGRRHPERFSDCMVSNPPGLAGPVIVYR